MKLQIRITSILLSALMMLTMVLIIERLPVYATSDSIGVAQVSCGQYHTGILKADGSLWMTGDNSGTLGDGTTVSKTTPIKIMDDVAQVSCGSSTTAILKTDGSLWMTGSNYSGALGDGTKESKTTPIKTMDDVAQVSCGYYCTAILKTDGSLWMTGYNDLGTFGNGTTTGTTTPIKTIDDVAQVSCGYAHTAILKTDGSLWMTGYNNHGQLGDGTKINKTTPIKIMDDVAQVSCGENYTSILKEDGSLWMTGSNDGQFCDGTLGDKTTPIKIMDDVAQVSCGLGHTAILKTDGSLWMAGLNKNGELGDGTTEDKTTPIKIMDDVAQVSCGYSHTAILKTDGSLWMTGYNYYGQLGDGTTEKKTTPVKIFNGKSGLPDNPQGEDVVIEDIPDQSYTGRRCMPSVSVWLGEYNLVEDIDYTSSYRNNTNIGTAFIDIELCDQFVGTRLHTISFNIVNDTTIDSEDLGYKLTIQTATKSSERHYEGDTVTIKDNDDILYKHFSSWEVVEGDLSLSADELKSNPLTIVMPASDVSLAAVYTGQSLEEELDDENSRHNAIIFRASSLKSTIEMYSKTIENIKSKYGINSEEYRLAVQEYQPKIDNAQRELNRIDLDAEEIKHKENTDDICKNHGVMGPSVAEVKYIRLDKNEYDYIGDNIYPAVTVIDSGDNIIGNESYDVVYPDDCSTPGIHTLSINFKGDYVGSKTKDFIIIKHKYDAWTTTKEATCTTDGSRESVCVDCGKKVEEIIPAFGHQWNESYTVDKEATCTEEGQESIHCSVCDAIDKDSVRAIDKIAHNYGDWKVTKEVTCTEDGSKEKVCSGCGDKVTEVIASPGHQWNESYTVDKEATCTEEGQESIHCSVCDAIDKDSVRAIDKIAHNYGDWKVTKEVTCTEDGTKEKVCIACGNKVTETIPSPGHQWNTEPTVDKPATYTEEGSQSIHCSVCNEIQEGSQEVIPMREKMKNTMTAKAAKKTTVKYVKVKKKAITVKPITVKNPQGTVSYKLVSGNAKSKKALKLNKKTGKVTVKRKTAKGTYKIKVKVTAAGTDEYKAASKNVNVTVVVR